MSTLSHQKRDVRALALTQRRQLLDGVLVNASDPVRVSAVLHASAKDLIRAVQEQGLEGLIAKRSSSRYETGERSGSWLKYKRNRDQELVIGGYKPGGKSFFETLASGITTRPPHFYHQDQERIYAGNKTGALPALEGSRDKGDFGILKWPSSAF